MSGALFIYVTTVVTEPVTFDLAIKIVIQMLESNVNDLIILEKLTLTVIILDHPDFLIILNFIN